MGQAIRWLRQRLEPWAGDRPRGLRFSGGLITAALVLTSAGAGWLIERLWLHSSGLWQWAAGVILIVALASALAARSLHDSVMAVVKALPAKGDEEPTLARERLSWIVGRETKQLSGNEILRAAAETASENAVDGIFAPLFWMLVGVALWSAGFKVLAPSPWRGGSRPAAHSTPCWATSAGDCAGWEPQAPVWTMPSPGCPAGW